MNLPKNEILIREKILSELKKLVTEIDQDMQELQTGLDALKKEVILRLAKDLDQEKSESLANPTT